MPIFEFRCLKCGNIFEKLFLNNEENEEIACPHCNSQSFEKVVSETNYALGAGGVENKQPKITSRSCGPSNNCMTLELPGPK